MPTLYGVTARNAADPIVGPGFLWRAGVAVAVAGAVAAIAFHDRLFLGVAGESGYLERFTTDVVDGVAHAPYQYRVLVPHLYDLLQGGGDDVGAAAHLVDTMSLAAATALGVLLFRRSAVPGWLAAGGLWVWAVAGGLPFLPKPETLPSFAVLTAAFLVLADERLPRLLLVPLGALLLGMRADLAFVLGLGFVVRSRTTRGDGGRARRDLATGLALCAGAIAATLALAAAYPDAEYEATGLVQLRFNASADVAAVAVAVTMVPFLPLAAARRRELLRVAHPVALPLLVPLAAQVAITAVVGRLHETRIFLPFAWGAALGGALLWQAALATGRDRP